MEYYFGFMRFRTKIIFIFMGLILSCSENNDSIESSEILDTQFTFHQDVGMLYFSMTVDTVDKLFSLDWVHNLISVCVNLVQS